MKSKHNITRLSHFEQSPSEQLGAVGVHLHSHDYRPATVAGLSGDGSWQHFHDSVLYRCPVIVGDGMSHE